VLLHQVACNIHRRAAGNFFIAKSVPKYFAEAEYVVHKGES